MMGYIRVLFKNHMYVYSVSGSKIFLMEKRALKMRRVKDVLLPLTTTN
jgi:hypothetical protein